MPFVIDANYKSIFDRREFQWLIKLLQGLSLTEFQTLQQTFADKKIEGMHLATEANYKTFDFTLDEVKSIFQILTTEMNTLAARITALEQKILSEFSSNERERLSSELKGLKRKQQELPPIANKLSQLLPIINQTEMYAQVSSPLHDGTLHLKPELKKQLCELLGLDVKSKPMLNFTMREINVAHKEMQLKYHPDKAFKNKISNELANVVGQDINRVKEELINDLQSTQQMGMYKINGFLDQAETNLITNITAFLELDKNKVFATILGVLQNPAALHAQLNKQTTSTWSTLISMQHILLSLALGLSNEDGLRLPRSLDKFAEHLPAIRDRLKMFKLENLNSFVQAIREKLPNEITIEFLASQINKIVPAGVSSVLTDAELYALDASINANRDELKALLDDNSEIIESILETVVSAVTQEISWDLIIRTYFSALLVMSNNLVKYVSSLIEILGVIRKQKGDITFYLTAPLLSLLSIILLPVHLVLHLVFPLVGLALTLAYNAIRLAIGIVVALVSSPLVLAFAGVEDFVQMLYKLFQMITLLVTAPVFTLVEALNTLANYFTGIDSTAYIDYAKAELGNFLAYLDPKNKAEEVQTNSTLLSQTIFKDPTSTEVNKQSEEAANDDNTNDADESSVNSMMGLD